MNTESVVPKKSKGQLFKEQYGYSKTMKRNMKKNAIYPSLEGVKLYAEKRKERKALQKQAEKKRKVEIRLKRKDKTVKKK